MTPTGTLINSRSVPAHAEQRRALKKTASTRARFRTPLVIAGCAQLCAWLAVEALSLYTVLPIGIAVLIAGGLGGGLSALARLPSWWCWIGFLMPFAIALSLYADLHPAWYLAAFLLTLSLFRGAPGDRVPLYLSNRQVLQKLEQQLPARNDMGEAAVVVDLGAGIGTTLAWLSKQRPDLHFVGIETAPLSCLIAKLRFAGCHNVTFRCGDLWKENLAHADFVYAYLSPEPMPDLWHKVRREMRPGARFASYRFIVPDVEPSLTLPVKSGQNDWLYLWQL
jgi:SAM-dependent methyltransferase